jgi:hypothetical protein
MTMNYHGVFTRRGRHRRSGKIPSPWTETASVLPILQTPSTSKTGPAKSLKDEKQKTPQLVENTG